MSTEVSEALERVGNRAVSQHSTHGGREVVAARRVEALSLRMAGLSYDTIADRLGVESSRARQIVIEALGSAENTSVTQLREVENLRLDRAQAAIWSKVLEGDLAAVDTYLRISARRAKMNGLDAPAKVDLSVSIKQEMEQALTELEAVVLSGEVLPDNSEEG